MRYLLLIISLLILPLYASGQFHFSQYGFTSQRTSPSAFVHSEYALAEFAYRSQQTAGPFRLNSSFLEASYPFRRKGAATHGIAISILDDHEGKLGAFRTNDIGLSYAVMIPVARYQSLSFGLKTAWINSRVSLDDLYTGSQYIPGRGFAESGSGEAMEMFNGSALTFNPGFHWQKTNKKGVPIAYFGFSVYNLNSPDDQFGDMKMRLPVTGMMMGGITAFSNDQIEVMPDFLLTISSSSHAYVGATTMLKTLSNSTIRGPVRFITRYTSAGLAVLGVQLETEQFDFGTSYDVPVTAQVGNRGAFEVAIRYKSYVSARRVKKRLGKLKHPKRKKKSRYAIRSKPRRSNIKHSPSVKTASASSGTDTVKIEINDEQVTKKVLSGEASVGEPAFDRPEIEHFILRFGFEFNKVELDRISTQKLDGLIDLLNDSPGLKVILTGHTDDRGSDAFNLTLGRKRALEVKDYLTQHGINADRVTVHSKGEREPSVPNTDESSRSMNRRVEIVVRY